MVLRLTVYAGPQSLMQRLFTKPPPKVRTVGKESGGRGRGRGGRTTGPVRYVPVPTAQEPMQGPDTHAYASQQAPQASHCTGNHLSIMSSFHALQSELVAELWMLFIESLISAAP